MFLPAVPVADILEGIHNGKYVLPAIQREFVWSTDQITGLFDSLMRGYPIGAFLFWEVQPATVGDYTFYAFITDYHEKDHPFAPVKQVPVGQSTMAILDGQQRLTALNIGLYGSHAERQPRKWWNNPDAYPKKRLYLNLLDGPDVDELGRAYDFRFLTEAEAKPGVDEPDKWFLVHDVLKLANSGPGIMKELVERGLDSGTTGFEVLYELYRAVREVNSINAFLERSQSTDKVLDIFVRVNSGGTPLSYSDLLLSMATNQWVERDAREEVRSLVADLNDGPAAFSFSKDLVLKTGLVIIGASDIRFTVSNFTQQNMTAMEHAWPDLRSSLLTASQLLASFGLTGRTLTADSVAIPIAYYVNHRRLDASYLSATSHAADRQAVQQWVIRSIMKRGIWGSSLDQLLLALREAIRVDGSSGWPLKAIESAMAQRGKSLKFDDAEVDDLLDVRYGSPRAFPVLATLYPGLDLGKSFHEDHIYPKSRFTRSRLLASGVPEASVDEFRTKVDSLPNLQLLQGPVNIAKQAAMPWDWLAGPAFVSDAARTQYKIDNDLDVLSADMMGFLDFYQARRQRLARRLATALGTGL